MYHIKLLLVIAIIVVSANISNAYPNKELKRDKRISDQRLAELETLIALGNMNKKLVTIPIGFGMVDPHKLGRRRRSINIIRQLLNDLSSSEERTSHGVSYQDFRSAEDSGEDLHTQDILRQDKLNDKLWILSYPHKKKSKAPQ